MPPRLLDLLFPSTSLLGSDDGPISEKERALIRQRMLPLLVDEKMLHTMKMPALEAVVAASKYDSNPVLKKAILTFKYHRISTLKSDLGEWMNSAITGLLLPPLCDEFRRTASPKPVLCPVPLHWTRKFWRGFNQAELLARYVGKVRGWPVEELLKRTRPTGHQARRNRSERLTALKHAFTFVGQTPPTWVVLIDDICTTGSTLHECALALKKAGVKHVSALVVAYG